MTILETERLLFRNHIAADLDSYCEIESDPVYRAPQKVHPRTELERSFRESVSPPKPMGLLATVFKPEGKYIGRIGLYPRRGDDNALPGEAVLAFYLARPYWGRGLATEAGRAFIQHGFQTLGLSRIDLDATKRSSSNSASPSKARPPSNPNGRSTCGPTVPNSSAKRITKTPTA